MDITIATFNIQNKYKIKKYDGRDKYGDHIHELVKIIKENKIDIIGVQELTRRYKKRLLPQIEKLYKIVGRYRFTRLGRFIPFIDQYNETTSIISNKQVINSNTKYLPYIGGIPRIVTVADIKIKDQKIRVINTHLDNKSKLSKKLQLNKIYKLIKNSEIPTILLGDFNMTIEDQIFSDFLIKLQSIGYKRVSVVGSTHKKWKLPIDHIIIPNTWKIKKQLVLETKSKVSDHKPIIVKVSL